MNARFGKIASSVTMVAVVSFAISMILGFLTPTLFFSCLSSLFIGIGFVPFMIALTSVNRDPQMRAIGLSGIAFAIVYFVLILLVYYAEITTVRMNQSLSTETLSIISYGYVGSLFFNYDLLGYGFMGLSTFLIGFLVRPMDATARGLRMMLWLHGIFFPICLFMPMLPVFSTGTDTLFSVILLEAWCAYFVPLCVLGIRYFAKIQRLGLSP